MAPRTLLVVAALLAAPSHAQRHVERSRVQLLPVDVAAEVPAFKTYRDALQAAVAARDADRVLAMMHPEIAQGGLELALRQGGKVASSGATGPSGQAAIQRRPATTWHNSSDVKLRNAHLAVIARGKLLDYLLNDAHPDNGGKARFFASLGFSREDPERLVKALRDVAEQGEVVSSAESVHGEKCVVDGWLSVHTRESRQWSIRTVWIIDRGKDAPRLVTAYPGKE